MGLATKVVFGVEKATPYVGSPMQQLNSVESVYMGTSVFSLWILSRPLVGGGNTGCTILVGGVSLSLERCPVPM